MTGRRRDDLTGELFDFPIRPQGDTGATPVASPGTEIDRAALPGSREGWVYDAEAVAQETLFESFLEDGGSEPPPLSAPGVGVPAERRSVALPAAGEQAPATAGERLWAGLIDVFFHMVAVALGFAAALGLGVSVGREQWPGFALFATCFSFLYVSVPLAFWGHTPGMAWLGLKATDLDGRPLAFSQTTRRWVAAICTALLLGLPLLFSFGGRSFADLLSSSRTFAELEFESGD